MFMNLILLLGMLSGLTQSRLIERAAFMQGCWERRAGNRVVEEQWMKPRGGVMMGMSRTVRGDTVVEYEFVRLFEQGGALVYAAQPSGQSPAEFTSTQIREGGITFANPQHDFPQRISYRLAGDSLYARIEGTMNGRERGVDFRYARVRCEQR
jgi:hypothetical protein